MKIKFIVSYFYPQKAAGANRINSMAKSLLQMGNQVEIYYLREPGDNTNLNETKKYFNSNRISLHPLSQRKLNIENMFARMFYEIYYAIRLVITARATTSDRTIISIPYTMLLPATLLLPKPGMVLDIRDLIWLYNDFKRGRVNKLITVTLESICIRSIKRAECVLTTNSFQTNYISSISNRVKIFTISNGVSDENFHSLSSSVSDINPKFTVTYAGTIGYPQGLIVLAVAAKILQDVGLPIKVIVVGTGKELKLLTEYSKANNLENIQFIQPVGKIKLLDIYKGSSLLFAHLRTSESLNSAVPSKLYEYLATGLPVLYGGGHASVEALSEFENIYLFPQDDPSGLADSLIEAYNSRNNIRYSDKNISIIKQKYIRENIFNNSLNRLLYNKE